MGIGSVRSCVPMMVTVRKMRNAAALYVEDVYVHLHIKVLYVDAWVPKRRGFL